jgi:hypothetical protein
MMLDVLDLDGLGGDVEAVSDLEVGGRARDAVAEDEGPMAMIAITPRNQKRRTMPPRIPRPPVAGCAAPSGDAQPATGVSVAGVAQPFAPPTGSGVAGAVGGVEPPLVGPQPWMAPGSAGVAAAVVSPADDAVVSPGSGPTGSAPSLVCSRSSQSRPRG